MTGGPLAPTGKQVHIQLISDEDDASDIDNDDDDEDFEYSHSDYLSANHSSAQAVTAHSSPFKDLTNIGGGGKNQQKLKEVDSTEVTTSLSASFFHNLSSTFADSHAYRR